MTFGQMTKQKNKTTVHNYTDISDDDEMVIYNVKQAILISLWFYQVIIYHYTQNFQTTF